MRAMSRRSVDALWQELETRKSLVRPRPAPQFDRAEQALAMFLLAILIDQPLEPCRRIRVSRNHGISVRERIASRCALLHSADRLQLPEFH